MRILHTADWHLGQTFFSFDRVMEHRMFLSYLLKSIKDLKVDVLLISGDVFDNPNPSAQSQRMYYEFLHNVTQDNPELQIIIIAGNHDSAARLEAPNPLLETMNVTVRGLVRHTPDGDIDYDYLIVPLLKGGYCLAVPYLRQGDYPPSESYSEGVAAMYRILYDKVKKSDGPIIALGHLQATGSEISDGDDAERANKVVIGGLECISPDSFDKGITYTALGHLHRGQRVSYRDNVRYAGAPIPMSFAEKNNKQGVVLIDFEDGKTTIEPLHYESMVRLLSIPSSPMPPEGVISAIEALPDGEITDSSPYLEIKVLVTIPDPSLRSKIEEALKSKSVRLAKLSAISPKNEEYSPHSITFEEMKATDPMQMAINYYKRYSQGEDMPDTYRRLLTKAIEEAKNENTCH